MRVLIWVIQARAFASNIASDKTGFFLKKKKQKQTKAKQIDLAHEILILIVSAMQVCAYCACVTLQQNQVSHKVKCSKDIKF